MRREPVPRADHVAARGTLDAEHLDGLRARASRRLFPAGSLLFREGDPSDCVHLVQRGRITISCAGSEGRETLLAVRGPGDVLGELGVLDGRARAATATAVEDVDTFALPAAAFLGLVERDGRLALGLLRVVDTRLRDADRQRAHLGTLDVPARLALQLLELARWHGQMTAGGRLISLALTQDGLAALVGSSREAVAKALRMFREQGWVTTGRRQVTLLDEEALRHFTQRAGGAS